MCRPEIGWLKNSIFMKKFTVEYEQSIFQRKLEQFQRRIVSAVEHKRMTMRDVIQKYNIKDITMDEKIWYF